MEDVAKPRQRGTTRPSAFGADSLRALFEPGSVAVVGANPNGVGGIVLQNLRTAGYIGEVHGVNPKYTDVLGYRCVGSLADLPSAPDVVVLALARERVVPALEAAVEVGVRAAIVFAIGFGELGGEGAELERRLVQVAREGEIALLGPNCQGLLNFAHAAPLYMDPAARYEAGRVGLVAQSGSIGTSLINNPRGVRWSHAVSSGNEAVVTTGDILGYYVDCPQVDVVCAFVETIRAPDLFFEHCDRAWELGKPVIACATGRTQEAQAAAVAHSGALAVPSRMVDAALERHGVIRVESLEEMLETAIAMEAPRRPRGRGVAVLTASGGQIELYHDHVPRESLNTPPLSSDIQQELRGLLADFLATNNPLDWWGDADWEARLPKIVDCVARDPAIDIVLQVGDFTAWPTGDGMRATIALDGIRPVAANRPDVLFVVLDTIGGSPSAHDVESARAEDVLVLSGYKDGLRALGHLVDYHLRDVHRPASPRAVEAGPIDLDGEPLEILARAGFDVARSITLDEQTSLDDVVVQLGRPVVAKIGDGDVLHKTELGGVILGIDSADELDDAVARLRARGAQTVVVQEQILDGVELLLGLQSATELGTFVVVGLGGIWTEVLDDVQVGFVGLTREDATAMLARLRGYPLLTGARGTPPVAADALVDAVLRLDSLGAVLGEAVQSLDINPLIVTADRAVAVDAIVVWR